MRVGARKTRAHGVGDTDDSPRVLLDVPRVPLPNHRLRTEHLADHPYDRRACPAGRGGPGKEHARVEVQEVGLRGAQKGAGLGYGCGKRPHEARERARPKARVAE